MQADGPESIRTETCPPVPSMMQVERAKPVTPQTSRAPGSIKHQSSRGEGGPNALEYLGTLQAQMCSGIIFFKKFCDRNNRENGFFGWQSA